MKIMTVNKPDTGSIGNGWNKRKRNQTIQNKYEKMK